MKKKVLILIVFIIIFSCIIFLITLNRKKEKEIVIINNLKVEFDNIVYLKDILNIEIDGLLDTSKLGNNDYNFETESTIYKINYDVVDTQSPIILGSSIINTTINKQIDLVNSFMCGDNYDSRPNCYIEGNYDINKLGKYNLKYIAIDTSGNKSSKNFTLNVTKPSNKSTSNSSNKTNPIENYINKYKNDNTHIGIDVSAWQDNIDWQKVKNNGVEFAILRIGYGHSNGEIKLDKWFINNIEKANEVGIDLGVYFFSYAKTKEESIEQAKWIVKTLDGQKLKLGIAFDWENWKSFNKYNISFHTLNETANSFIEEVEKNGYKGFLYSSAYYLNHIWKDYENVWLAYYTTNNDFEKSFSIWQLSSNGKVNGINGPVDIDILYD